MKQYKCYFNRKKVAEMTFEEPINQKSHILSDIRGDFMSRLKKDNVVFTSIEPSNVTCDGMAYGFIAYEASPTVGYSILDVTKEDE